MNTVSPSDISILNVVLY